MNFKVISRFATISAALLALSATANAASYCQPNTTNTDGMALSNVTFSGNTPTTSADDCYGILGGTDSSETINGLNLTWGSGWTFLVKDENTPAATGSFGGISYTLDGFTPSTTGNWTLTASPTGALPVFVDFIAVLKGSNEYGLWFFDNVKISADNNGTWQSVFTNNNGELQNLSHLTLYARIGDDPNPPILIPEPGTLALVGLALLGIGAVRRRRG